MYVLNPKKIPKDKKFICGRLVANWLITEANIPLMARDGKDFIFAKTDVLEECLKNIPWWMKVGVKF